MIRRIVADSSADMALLASDTLRSVPLKILLGTKEFVDDDRIDVSAFVDEMTASRDRSTSSCPNVYEWLEAFDGADEVFAVALSSNMSGSFATAQQAAQEYMEKHPDARVRVVDSASAGSGMRIQVERLMALCAEENSSFDAICEAFDEYHPHARLVFGMESVANFVKNGRLPAMVGTMAGILNLRFINRASAEGRLEQLKKVRGSSRMLDALVQQIMDDGYEGGRLFISHVDNERGASVIRDKVLALFPRAEILIYPCRALCSYYAERGGLLLGFEDALTPAL